MKRVGITTAYSNACPQPSSRFSSLSYIALSVRCNSAILRRPTSLHILAINARSRLRGDLTHAALVAAIKVDVLEVKGVNVAGDEATTL